MDGVVKRMTWSVKVGDRVAIRCVDDARPIWTDTNLAFTDEEMIEHGLHDHPALTAYVDAIISLDTLWEAIPERHRIKAEYRAHRMGIPHVEWAKDHEVWT